MVGFQMTDLFPYLGVSGPDLLLRSYGERAFALLEENLKRVDAGQALALDFDGISVMDTSFADETVLELALGLVAGRYGDRFLLLREPSAATVENIEGTLARRRSKVALLVRRRGGTEIVGEIEPNLADALQRTQQAGTLTARNLADELQLEINTASMRLHKLHKLHLLARDEEVSSAGRQHIYRLPG